MNTKTDSKTQKQDLKMKKGTKRYCKCMGKWIFVRFDNKNSQRVHEETRTYFDVVRKVKHVIKVGKPLTIGDAIEIALQEKAHEATPLKKSPRVIPIPKKGTEITKLVPVFAGLVATGILQADANVIMEAINNTSIAEKMLNEDQQATIDIEIAENLNLRLYKSGLALYTKA